MIKYLKKLLPLSFKKKIYNLLIQNEEVIVKGNDSNIPVFQVTGNSIENCKLLLSREELLKQLPKEGIVAELGVDSGDFSEMILKINVPLKLHLIDVWSSSRYSQEKRLTVENKFKNEISDGKVIINLGLSTEVSREFEDEYFDWVYIDTDHSYQTTINELEILRTKVKRGGIIAGHDYIIGNWNRRIRYGVIEAVHEFCFKYEWEIIFLTIELGSHPSFAIKKSSKPCYNL